MMYREYHSGIYWQKFHFFTQISSPGLTLCDRFTVSNSFFRQNFYGGLFSETEEREVSVIIEQKAALSPFGAFSGRLGPPPKKKKTTSMLKPVFRPVLCLCDHSMDTEWRPDRSHHKLSRWSLHLQYRDILFAAVCWHFSFWGIVWWFLQNDIFSASSDFDSSQLRPAAHLMSLLFEKKISWTAFTCEVVGNTFWTRTPPLPPKKMSRNNYHQEDSTCKACSWLDLPVLGLFLNKIFTKKKTDTAVIVRPCCTKALLVRPMQLMTLSVETSCQYCLLCDQRRILQCLTVSRPMQFQVWLELVLPVAMCFDQTVM